MFDASHFGFCKISAELDIELETQLRNQVKLAQESMQDAHRRLALKHVKNEALAAQLRSSEKKVI